ncbi:MAG: Na/Pi symporter, partial [Oscillospiraceae bacterium]|nr:Na/Pi symporter [Oscillospiraceae bacterium]
PSTLAPIALIIGIVLIMGFSFKSSKSIGNIAIGFGILFSGLLTMTSSVDSLTASGVFESLFSSLGSNPVLGYITGAAVAFVLQSSSAAVGILQAFSAAGLLRFNAIYAVIVGIYLGDCVTTAIVCYIGSHTDAKRVGIVNILFNLSKSALVLLAVFVLRQLGLLDSLWERVVTPGIIANTNSVFNLGCAICLFPLITVYEKLSRIIVKGKPGTEDKYKEKLDALSPAFFSTPAIALNSCYEVLSSMFNAAKANISLGFQQLRRFDSGKMKTIEEEEENIDVMADRLSSYMFALSSHLTSDAHTAILDQYHKLVTEFERLGDHALNMAQTGQSLAQKRLFFSPKALAELDILEDLISRIMGHTETAFRNRDVDAAHHIEPLEQVVDDVVYAMRENHLGRLRSGECSVDAGTAFIDVLGDLERVSDLCSNVGVSVVARMTPSSQAHDYISSLHAGKDEAYNREYTEAHEEYFRRIEAVAGKAPVLVRS